MRKRYKLINDKLFVIEEAPTIDVEQELAIVEKELSELRDKKKELLAYKKALEPK